MATALFGQHKFENFKFGKTDLKNPRYGLEVDWRGKGLFDGSNEGVNLQGLTISRGRHYTVSAEGDAFQAEDTGQMNATLLDLDGRYDPFNDNSPLHGNLTGGKAFRITVRTMSDAIYPLMAGTLDEPVSFAERGAMMARFVGTDGWSFLRDQLKEVTVPLQENVYVEEAMELVLRTAGWPRMWGWNLDAGVDLRNYFWVDARSAAQVIHDLAHNELGSVSVSANGSMRYKSRLSQEEEVLTLIDTDCINVQRMVPKDVIRNVIRVESAPRSEQAEQQVWEVPQRITIAAGGTINDVWAEFRYNNEVVPVKDPVTPVAFTDYDAFANNDGTGADLTSDISIAMYPFSTKGQISITNNGLSTAHVYVRVRAKPLARTNSVSFNTRDEASIRKFGARPFVLQVDQNVNTARQYRELLGALFTNSKNYLVVDLMPEPDVQFAVDLGDVIRARLNNYDIDAAYRVIGIRHEFQDRNGIVVRTRWWLEPFIRLFAGVQIPVQVPFQLGGVS
jgi:hypothetical protein